MRLLLNNNICRYRLCHMIRKRTFFNILINVTFIMTALVLIFLCTNLLDFLLKQYNVYVIIYQLLQKTFYCNDHTITEFGIIDNKNSFTAYVILCELIDTWFVDSNRRVGIWSLPWRWRILSIPLTTGRGTGAETCGLDDVVPPDDLCSRPEALC